MNTNLLRSSFPPCGCDKIGIRADGYRELGWEEKMTLKDVKGKTIQEFETKIIAKDGTITRVPGIFQGYEMSEEESDDDQGTATFNGFCSHPTTSA
ncbi:hypothetical protein Tco_1156299 [Tanacetum coccineum]